MLNARVCWVLIAVAIGGISIAARPRAEETSAARPPSPERSPHPYPKTPAEMAYYAKLQTYRRVRAAFDKEAAAYWDRISETRQARRKRRAEGRTIGLSDYVLDQPPVYRGPPAPTPPPSIPRPPRPSVEPAPMPVVADFLEQARAHYGFTPDTASSEAEFKRAYASAALQAGLSKDQAVRIYGFEASGNGRHDVQAGLEAPGSKRRAISTALGYNQLLVTNTIGLLAEHGERLIDALRDRARTTPERRARIEGKIVVMKHMIRFARSVPKKWSAHEELARTPKGWGTHALNLDIDIGPLLQAQKLADSLDFARRKGYTARLTAAELEMMNLMGDGSGFDVISMPEDIRGKVPTANMFQRGGYERNTVVRKFNTVSALLSATDAKMDSQTDLPGAKEMEAAFDAHMASAASAPVR